MKQLLLLAALPVLSGAIGWLTNFIAVKMLLKPIRPVRIFWFTFQGLLPRRHRQLAGRISAAIAKDFLTEENILEFIRKADTQDLLKEYIRLKWNERLEDILGWIPMARAFLSPKTLDGLRDRVADAFGGDAGEFIHLLAQRLEGRVDLEATIRENILAFDLERLESIIEEIASREFRYIERLGGIIGATIGLVQAGLVALYF